MPLLMRQRTMTAVCSGAELVKEFLEALPAARRGAAASAGLEEALCELWQRARSAHPEIVLPARVFLRFVAARLPAGDNWPEMLGELSAGDLYLASGCVAGDEQAVASFGRIVGPIIERAVAAIDPSPAGLEDAKQSLFQKLFVAPTGTESKICHYQGRGELSTWIRVIATRHAIDLKRRLAREHLARDGALPSLVAADDNPELRCLKDRYRPEFKRAFEGALQSLGERERNLLRYQLLHGLSIDQIGTIYRVHRATAARWLAAVRQLLLQRTRDALAESLHLSASEFESLARLLQSSFDVNVTGILRGQG